MRQIVVRDQIAVDPDYTASSANSLTLLNLRKEIAGIVDDLGN